MPDSTKNRDPLARYRADSHEGRALRAGWEGTDIHTTGVPTKGQELAAHARIRDRIKENAAAQERTRQFLASRDQATG